ncbi:universal stress protein [Pedobacter nyackensis]|uniref:universal stress protein n=1 Tax=Pedobacter nyackensis TaxID=475255 RepID=UPI00292E89BA|nr:universal stress protein [Pedobacter nyackensis]
METFSVKFRAGSLDLSVIVTEHDHHQKFKVEMVTNEPKPILLMRSVKGEWTIVERGLRNFSEHDFDALKLAIEGQLCETYSVKNMLVLTDFSESSSNAAKYAADLAHQLKSKNLILYHSYESVAIPATAFAPVTGRFTETHEQSLEKITNLKNEVEEWAPEETAVEVRTDERTLISAVNALTAQHYIGLVVAGITGKSSIERVLVGSNTVTLAKNCHAPLLIVPPVAVFQPISTVVFACDLKRVAESTPVLAIKTFVHALGAKLLILNVDYEGGHFDPDTIKEMTHLHELWDNEKPEYHYIDSEDTVAGIMEFARLQDAELVIMVPKHYGFFEGIFHRSLTKKLAYHTHRPLLLFREDT